MMLAVRKLPILNVMMTPRSARNAKLEIKVATPLLSVPPHADNHTQNASQVLENAQLVTQKPTRIALKLRMPATKNAQSNLFHHVTTMENVNHAQVEMDASQQLHVRRAASHIHTHHPHTDAHGTQPPHNVLAMSMEQ
jgi:hypothetical protein